MPTVSIILPCFNACKTIKTTLISIQKQSFSDFECLIINDNSTDNSGRIISEFIKYDKRFKLITNQKNLGVSFSRNLGISRVKSRYIAFIDSDDAWQVNFLDNSLKLHRRYNCGITHAPYYIYKLINKKYYGYLVKPPEEINKSNVLNKNFMGIVTVVLDKQICGDFKFKNIRPEDYDLWCNLILNKNLRSLSTVVPLAYVQVHAGQRSSNKLKAIRRLFNFYYNNIGLSKKNALFHTIIWIISNIVQKIAFRRLLKESIHKEIYR